VSSQNPAGKTETRNTTWTNSGQRGFTEEDTRRAEKPGQRLRPQQGSIAHLSEWLKLKLVVTTNAGKDAEKLNYSKIACENVKWYSHSGRVSQIL